MMKILGKFLFNLIGWKMVGEYPGNDRSFVIIVAPHTSNWDVPIGLCLKFWKNIKAKFYVKSEIFFPPLGWLLGALGALPVERRRSTRFVHFVIQDFKNRENHRIIITPEGTRKKVDKFKSGFYHIALGAQVPVLPIIFDYGNKQIVFKDLLYLSGDASKEIAQIEKMFEGVKGKYPELSFRN